MKLRSIIAAALLAAACSSQPVASQVSSNLPPDALRVLPAAAGWNTAALDEVMAYVGSQKTTGFLIIDNDRIVAERNWPLAADATTFRDSFVHGTASDGSLLEDVASQQKSFIALLVGIAADKKLLDVSKPVNAYLGAGWSKASPQQEAAITVLNLIEMNSGLKENLTFEAPAGAQFFYNTPAYAKLKPVLEKASGQTLDQITLDWLAKPAGMKDTSWRKRPGSFADSGNPTGLVTTPRDIARMGQIVLDRGVAADGKRVISVAQLNLILARSKTNPAYGRLWWLNGSDTTMNPGPNPQKRDGQFIPAAPRDLVAAMGAQDRKLYVVPSRKLIVVRTGQAAARDFNDQLWTKLTKAMPAR